MRVPLERDHRPRVGSVEPDTWHQGRYGEEGMATWHRRRCGEEGMPRVTKEGMVRRACHVSPSKVW